MDWFEAQNMMRMQSTYHEIGYSEFETPRHPVRRCIAILTDGYQCPCYPEPHQEYCSRHIQTERKAQEELEEE